MVPGIYASALQVIKVGWYSSLNMLCGKHKGNNNHKYLVLSAIVSVDTYSTQISDVVKLIQALTALGQAHFKKLVRTWYNAKLASF